MKKKSKLTHYCNKQVLDKTIDAGNVDEAVKAFANMLNEVNLDHPIENIHLRIVGIVRTGTHPRDDSPTVEISIKRLADFAKPRSSSPARAPHQTEIEEMLYQFLCELSQKLQD